MQGVKGDWREADGAPTKFFSEALSPALPPLGVGGGRTAIVQGQEFEGAWTRSIPSLEDTAGFPDGGEGALLRGSTDPLSLTTEPSVPITREESSLVPAEYPEVQGPVDDTGGLGAMEATVSVLSPDRNAAVDVADLEAHTVEPMAPRDDEEP